MTTTTESIIRLEADQITNETAPISLRNVLGQNLGKIHYSVDFVKRRLVNAIALPAGVLTGIDSGRSRNFRSVINPSVINPKFNSLHLIPRCISGVSGDYLNIYASAEINNRMTAVENDLQRFRAERPVIYVVIASLNDAGKLKVEQRIWDYDSCNTLSYATLEDNKKYSFAKSELTFAKQLTIENLCAMAHSYGTDGQIFNLFYNSEIKEKAYLKFLRTHGRPESLLAQALEEVRKTTSQGKLQIKLNGTPTSLEKLSAQPTSPVLTTDPVPNFLEDLPGVAKSDDTVKNERTAIETVQASATPPTPVSNTVGVEFETLEFVVAQIKRREMNTSEKNRLKETIGELVSLL